MSEIAVHVEKLGKLYRIGELQRYKTMRDMLSNALYAPFRAAASLLNGHNGHQPTASSRSSNSQFWALKDVSFEVKKGEVVGIIGRNGAGKSTLLRILSRITKPTEGYIRIHGRVGSLLEVGTGFHPELTGRENIYLNGAILGMRKKEIGRKFDEIVAFAEIEKFIDTPVKFYSSGMYIRLAFAVAAHLDPEILIVDEVLAVGDAAFQKKCLGRMSDVARDGRTVLFVSHNLGIIRDLCQQGIYLDSGRIATQGHCYSVVTAYLEKSSGLNTQSRWRCNEDKSDALAIITELFLASANGKQVAEVVMNDAVSFEMTLTFREAISQPQFGVQVHSIDGTPFLDLRTRHTGLNLPKAQGKVRVRATVASLGLYPGEYFLSPWVTDRSGQVLEWIQYCLKFTVLPRSGPYGDMRLSLNWGKYYVPSEWCVEIQPS